MKKLHISDEFKNLICGFTIETVSVNIGTIPAGGDKWGQTIQMTIPTGYSAVGIVGYMFLGSYWSYLSFSELYVSGDTIHYSVSSSKNLLKI